MITSKQLPRVAVVYGERLSPHHERSEASAREIVHALCEGPHEAVSYSPLSSEEWHILPQLMKRRADVVLLTTHGSHLRPGEAQRLFSDHGVLTTGPGPLHAALTGNPYLTNELLKLESLPVPSIYLVSRFTFLNDPDQCINYVRQYFGLPVYVQPITGIRGLHGVSVATFEELVSALETFFEMCREVVVYPGLQGRVFQCPVLDHGQYESAYPLMPVLEDGEAVQTESLIRVMRELAVAVHKAMKLRGYSELIFSYSVKGGPVVLSVNIVPMLHEGSALRRSLDAMALSVREFLHKLTQPIFGRR